VTTVHGNGFDFLVDRNGVSPHELTLCRMLHWITTIIQWFQKISKAVQKMAKPLARRTLRVYKFDTPVKLLKD
jgi:hypothetical protein